jgi:hypothetical protein
LCDRLGFRLLDNHQKTRSLRLNEETGNVDLVPRQATFARFTSSRSVWSWALRLRQAM